MSENKNDSGADAAAVESAGSIVTEAASHAARPMRWRAVLSHEKQPQILYSGLVCILERSPDQWTSVVDETGYSPCDRESTDRHAHLIAAAPELYEALKDVTAWLEAQRDFQLGNAMPEEYEAAKNARAAIAKAEGQQS